MRIDEVLATVEATVHALSGRLLLRPSDTHPTLLAIADALGSPPYEVHGPQARFRWQHDGVLVEVGVDRFFDEWEVGYRAFPYEPDVSRREQEAFASATPDLAPPYLWSIAPAEEPVPSWRPGPFLLPRWADVATELGFLLAMLPTDLATIPPAWFHGPVILGSTLGGRVLSVRAEPDRLTMTVEGVEVSLDADQARRAGKVIGRIWATTYEDRAPGDLTIGIVPTTPPFRLLPTPGGAPTGPGGRTVPDAPLEPATVIDLLPFTAAVPEREPPPRPGGTYVAAYASPREAAGLIDEVVRTGIPAFVEHHELVAAANRYGIPELRASPGWRVRVRGGTIDLTVLDAWRAPAAIRDYTRDLLGLLDAAYGEPWGSACDSRGRLNRTWRIGDLAVRAGSAGTAVVIEVTRFDDLMIYHFG